MARAYCKRRVGKFDSYVDDYVNRAHIDRLVSEIKLPRLFRDFRRFSRIAVRVRLYDFGEILVQRCDNGFPPHCGEQIFQYRGGLEDKLPYNLRTYSRCPIAPLRYSVRRLTE